MTFPVTRSAARIKLCLYVTDMICGSRVQPSLLGEERHERAAEIEPNSQDDLQEVKKALFFNNAGCSSWNSQLAVSNSYSPVLPSLSSWSILLRIRRGLNNFHSFYISPFSVIHSFTCMRTLYVTSGHLPK